MLRLGGSKTERIQLNKNIIKTVQKREIRVIDKNTSYQYSYSSLEAAKKAIKSGELKPSKYIENLEVLHYNQVAVIGNYKFYDMEYRVTSVKEEDGTEKFFNTHKLALEYCANKEKKEEKTKSVTPKEIKSENQDAFTSEVEEFKKKVFNESLYILYQGDDLEIAKELVQNKELTRDDLRVYQYYACVVVFNKLVRKMISYLKKEGLFDVAGKKGFPNFLKNYIFDREEVERWVTEEVKVTNNCSTEYYANIFSMFKQKDIVTSCGAGYLLEGFHNFKFMSTEDEIRAKEVGNILAEKDFKQIVI